MLAEQDLPQASRGGSRTSNAGSAGTTSSGAVGRRRAAAALTRAERIDAAGIRAAGAGASALGAAARSAAGTGTTTRSAAGTGAASRGAAAAGTAATTGTPGTSGSADAATSGTVTAGAARPGTSTTGSLGSRSSRKKKGLFHRTGIALPAGFLALLLVVVVWGAAKVMNPKGNGASSLFDSVDALGTSTQVSGLTQEYQTLLAMTAASKSLQVAAKPAYLDADEVIASLNDSSGSDETGGTSVTTMALPANPSAAQTTAKSLLSSFGFASSQWSCLYSLWEQESTWNVYAENAASGAYGIPQSLPGSKMASVGADWRTNPATQIKWGLGYIKQVYGTPCAAWNNEETRGFY